MVAPLLIPVLTTLATKGLDLIGSAILAKGKDVVEKELGVNIDDALKTEEGTEQLRMAQMTHEEKLLELALSDKKLDQDYFRLEVADADSARKREVAIIENAEHAGWLNTNLVPIMALLVIIGGGWMLSVNSDTDVKFAVTGMMTLVLGYYFGKSSNDWRKDSTINKLTDKV